MTNIQDDQHTQTKPNKADVDELLKQLEALNQEIAAKTVAEPAQLEEKKDEAVKLEPPTAIPAIESSDELQLPAGDQANDQANDQENDQEKTQSKDLDLDNFIDELEAKIAEQPEPVSFSQEDSPGVEENFSRQRPSLDLSGVAEEQTPIATPTLSASEPEAATQPVEPVEPVEAVDEENLESQNIFTMLGLDSLEKLEKEDFLADLEELIWENFIEVELPLLLNSEERTQAEQILADKSKEENERKEALLTYLEKFIPDLEEIMYKKALSLKKEMFEERMKKIREEANEENNLGLLADLDQIQELIEAGRYKTATELLNKA